MASEFAISTAQPAPVAPPRPLHHPQPDGPPSEGGGADRDELAADPGSVDRRGAEPPGTERWAVERPALGDVIATWSCPVCGTACDRRYRPGRARVYCTNACRQRAYRWRRDHRSELASAHPRPPRARTRDRSHALRSTADLVGDRRDSVGRQITACGSFGRAVADRPANAWHTDFVAGTPWSCRTCTAVLGVSEIPVPEMLARARTHVASVRNLR